MSNENDQDERDPGHTLEACVRKFSELPARIWIDRDPGDEDERARNVELFRVTPGERFEVRLPGARGGQ